MGQEEEILYALQKLEEAENNRIKNFGIEAYIPNKHQFNAHIHPARTILLIGGNRIGKSTYGAAELTFHVTRNYPDWYPQEKRFKGPIKGAISATRFQTVQTVIEPKLFTFLPRDYYKYKRTAQGYLQRVVCKDGSTIDILTQEMKNEAYESMDWDFIWCDEPQSQFKYQAMRRGLVDRMGRMVMTFTPLTEPWMKDELVDKADGKKMKVFTVDIRENKFDIKGNPILSEEAIQDFEESLPEDIKEARLHGQFLHLRGTVYKEFSDVHVDPDLRYNPGDPVVCVLDPHDRQPHHLIWASVDRDDDIYVLEEMMIHCELETLAKRIRAFEKAHKFRMWKRLIDPNFGRKPAKPGVNTSVIKELGRYGASFYESDDNIELGHMVVREYLHYDLQKPVTAVNKPKLFFHAKCVETIKSMRNLQYDEWKGDDEKSPKELEKQKDTHGADCIRYLCVSKPRWFSHRREEEQTEPAY